MNAETLQTMTTMEEEAVAAVLAARDFCGNESEAIVMVESDNGVVFSEADKRFIIGLVDHRWNLCRTAAGVVSPLSSIDRNRAFSALS